MGSDKKIQELKEAKLNLYRLLLEKGHENFSETEIELSWNLSKDGQVQGHVSESVRAEREADAMKLAAVAKEAPTNDNQGTPVQTQLPA